MDISHTSLADSGHKALKPAAHVAADSPRTAFIDHIRVVLTMLVILHHAAIMYGGSGGWYWREEANASNTLLVMFNAVNQSFFMGFFFLLAGYFTPPAFERKGTQAFVRERLWRLGVPLLCFFFLLQPLTIALARLADGQAFWSGWLARIADADFGPGPLWFVEALLLFAGAYLLMHHLAPVREPRRSLPGAGALLAAALVLGLVSFTVRLVVPVGEEVLWLQLGYFPCYIWLFAAGCAAADGRLLERVTLSQALPWLVSSALCVLSLPLLLARQNLGAFEGGWNLNALLYALWDPLLGWGVILGALWAARTYWNRTNATLQWLARGAYAAYIVHPPVVVALGVLAVEWDLAPLVKFAVVGALATAGSFICGALLCRLPALRRIL